MTDGARAIINGFFAASGAAAMLAFALATTIAAPTAAACEEIAHCFAGRQFNNLMGDVEKAARSRGRKWFGGHFNVQNRLRYSVRGETVSGDADAIFPLFSRIADKKKQDDVGFQNALFLQTGVSKWRYKNAADRYDARYGLVYRFAPAAEEGGGVFGLWTFARHDAKNGHAGMSFGGDYEGEYGRAAASYFVPVGGWQSDRPGYVQRAVRGGDIRFQLKFGRISARARASHWQNKNAGKKYKMSANIRMQYEPREWLRLSGAWRGSEKKSGAIQYRADIRIPLGGPTKARRARKYRNNFAAKAHAPIRSVRKIDVRERKNP